MLALIQRLEETPSGQLPVNELAEHLGVHRKTVLRYIAEMERRHLDDQGRPVVRREHRSGVAWAVLVGARSPLSATIFQYAATFAASRHLESARGTVLADGAEEVLDRVEASMPASVRGLVPRVLQAFHYVPFAPKDHSGSEDTLDTLVRAVLKRCRVEVDYVSAAGRASSQVLEPWSVFMYRDGFYMLARRPGDSLRLYAVERIVDIRLQRGSTFTVPDDFRPSALSRHHLGLWQSDAAPERVVIAFAPHVARVVRARAWRGFIAYRERTDGHLELELELVVTPEIVSWLMSWGDSAVVVAPESLRERVRASLTAALEKYT